MNEHRGDVPFRALGRELFLAYRTSGLAKMQSALGFRRPDPLAAPTWEEIVTEEELEDVTDPGKWVKTAVTKRQLIGFTERQARILSAFEAVFLNPGPGDLLVMVRIGLEPWEKQTGTKLTDEEFENLAIEFGQVGLRDLHFRTVGAALGGGEEGKPAAGDDDPNGESAAAVSSTSTVS